MWVTKHVAAFEVAFGVPNQHRTVGGGGVRKSRGKQDGEKSALRLNGALRMKQHPSPSTFRFPGTPTDTKELLRC